MDDEALNALMDRIKSPNLPMTKKGIGVKNVYQRLKIYYGDAFSFNITSTPDEGTTVMLKFSIYNEYFDE
jgi:two-component system sensor histidine kinase YesM